MTKIVGLNPVCGINLTLNQSLNLSESLFSHLNNEEIVLMISRLSTNSITLYFSFCCKYKISYYRSMVLTFYVQQNYLET